LAHPETVEYIAIGTDTFVYDRGYLELRHRLTPVQIAARRRLFVADRQKISGYGQASSAGAIQSYSGMNDNRGQYDLKVRERILFRKQILFYISTGEGHFLPLTRKNLLKAFPGKKGQLEAYLDREKPNLNKEEDVQALMHLVKGTS
ncbi:MAG TPA: hypothetical protein VHK69_06230, partial [Chitinophagaceae bacterium]|nr:hypothetical protein [Chitinophagaceae bacterium]